VAADVTMADKIPCPACGALILPATAAANGGLCTPCKRGFRGNIDDGRHRNAERKAQRADLDPAAKHWRWLLDQVYRTEGGFAGLSPENQRYFAVCLLEGEVYNGGFDQYFTNSSADYYACALRGLADLGALECGRLLVSAKNLLFGGADVSTTKATRWAQMRKLSPAQEEELETLDKRFCRAAVALHELVAKQAREHRLYEG
jgi:hypothetical protein